MNAKEMWTNYTKQFCENKDKTYEAWHFANDEKNANELAELVVNGEKTATASGFCFYEFEHEEIPKVGSFSIVLDWNDNAKCIIKISKVCTAPFNKVTLEHACKEGEGDKTLLYWRNVHKKFFSEELNEYKKVFNENMMVVCEEFEVVWK